MRNRDREDGGNLPERLRKFADFVAGDSPLYATLGRVAATDPIALDILAEAPYRLPPANILLAAVHHLLLSGEPSPLATHYPSVTGREREPVGDAADLFRRFCAEHAARLTELVTTRGVQTNEVRRCTSLLPAFATVAASEHRPLSLIEVGPSAGLNLLFDRYRYDYGPAGTTGPGDSPLTLSCEVLEGDPPIPQPLPEVGHRLGVDLHPVDLGDPDAVAWMRALVWPEQIGRMARLDTAIAIAREDPPHIVRGDAAESMPGLLEGVPPGTAPLVYHSYVLNQMPEDGRRRLDESLLAASHRGPVHRVSIDHLRPEDDYPPVTRTLYEDGEASRTVLGTAHFHGKWIRWWRRSGSYPSVPSSSAMRARAISR